MKGNGDKEEEGEEEKGKEEIYQEEMHTRGDGEMMGRE